MPRVPQRDQQVRTGAARTSFFQLDPKLDRTGNAVANAAQGVGNELAQIGERNLREMEAAKAFEFRRQLDQWELDNIRDPQRGALYRRGQDALGVAEKADADLATFSEQLKQTASGPRQARMLDELVQQRRTSVVANLQAHEARERRTFAETEIKSALDQTTNNIAAYWNDPERVSQELQWGEAAIIEQGRMSGQSASVTNSLIDEYRSQAQKARILFAMDSDPFAAKEVMDQVDSQLLPVDRLAINRSLEPAIKMKTGERRGQQVFNRWRSDPEKLSVAMDELNQIEDEDERRAAKSMFSDLRAAEKQRTEEVYTGSLNSAWEVVLGGQHWSAIPPSTMSALKPSDRAALMKFKTGGGVTDWNLFTSLSETYARDPKAFMAMSPGTYLNNLAESERRTVLGWRRDVSAGIDDASQRAWISTRNAIVNQGLAGMGIETGAKASTNQVKQADEFRSVVAREYEAWLASNPGKKTMPETEFRSLVNRLAVEVKLPGTGIIFDDKARVYQVQPDQPVRMSADDIPAAERRLIEQALLEAQIEPTEDLMVRLYLQGSNLNVE